MDFGPLIAQHRDSGADLTIATARVAREPPYRFHTLDIGSEGLVQGIIAPGSDDATHMALVGALLFSTDVLNWRLGEDAYQSHSTHDLICDVIPHMIQAKDRIFAFQFAGYWNSLQTVQDYWQASMDLLGESPLLNLQDTSWPIRTQFEVRPPTRVASGARITHSLISEGCIVDGTVEYSILSPGVCVAPGAVVRHSIVMHNTSIEERAFVENAVLDMDVIVGPQARVGRVRRHAPTIRPVAPPPLTIVGKDMHIPAHETIAPESMAKDWILTQRQDLSSTHVDAV
jgi:glucose-1-phosphate adenylyltransferase